MSIESAITTLIKADTAVKSLIGKRLFPLTAPQGQPMPHIVYEQAGGGGDELTTDGPNNLIDIQFRFTAWAARHKDVVALAWSLRELLKDYSGTVGGIVIQCTHVIGTGDVPGVSAQAEQLDRYGRYIDCIISYEN